MKRLTRKHYAEQAQLAEATWIAMAYMPGAKPKLIKAAHEEYLRARSCELLHEAGLVPTDPANPRRCNWVKRRRRSRAGAQ